jgi:hypothetical protein
MNDGRIEQLAEPESAQQRVPQNWAEREAMIARAAYFRAEQRGFAPGHELEDWLAAEAEIDWRWCRG